MFFMLSTQLFTFIYENYIYSKMLGCFNPILGKIWKNPAIRLHF